MTESYQASWESLTQHQIPQWFRDGKFGLYAHWGIYAVPGFGNEWYGKWMYDPSHEIHQKHVERFGSPAQFGYKDFIPQFTAEHYDPDEWAELFAASGAGYAGFSLAHHDGFGLWDSDVYRWNVGKMGPQRDLYGELATALRGRGLRLVAPFHIVRGYNWFLAGWNQWDQTFDAEAVARGLAEGWDLFDPEYADFYWIQQTSKFADFFASMGAQSARSHRQIPAGYDVVRWRQVPRSRLRIDSVGDPGALLKSEPALEAARRQRKCLPSSRKTTGHLLLRARYFIPPGGAGAQQIAGQHAIQFPS